MIGIANQDQEVAELLATWEVTDLATKAAIVEWIADDDPNSRVAFLSTCPDGWIDFLQKCVLIGLRGAILSQNE
jgi:hypothetical protein